MNGSIWPHLQEGSEEDLPSPQEPKINVKDIHPIMKIILLAQVGIKQKPGSMKTLAQNELFQHQVKSRHFDIVDPSL